MYMGVDTLPVTVMGAGVCTVYKSVSCRRRIKENITLTGTSPSNDFL